jgi:hypothetical protein
MALNNVLHAMVNWLMAPYHDAWATWVLHMWLWLAAVLLSPVTLFILLYFCKS